MARGGLGAPGVLAKAAPYASGRQRTRVDHPGRQPDRCLVHHKPLRWTNLLPQDGSAPETREQYVFDLADAIRSESWHPQGTSVWPIDVRCRAAGRPRADGPAMRCIYCEKQSLVSWGRQSPVPRTLTL